MSQLLSRCPMCHGKLETASSMVNGVKVTMLSCDECGARFRSTERNADKYVYLESMGRNPRGLSLTVEELQKRDKPVQWLEVANITSGAVRECGNCGEGMSVFHTHLRAGKVDSVNRLVVGVIIADAVTGEDMPVLMYVCPNCHKMEFFFSR